VRRVARGGEGVAGLRHAAAARHAEPHLAALRGRALLGLGRSADGRAELERAIGLLREEGRGEEDLAPLRALLVAGRGG
jgi:hypothetical protein